MDILANSYMPTTSVTPCGAAEADALQKKTKYANIIQSYIFIRIAIKTLGPINIESQHSFDRLGESLSSISGFQSKTSFLFQRISVLIQSFKLVTFFSSPEPVFNVVINHRDFCYRGYRKELNCFQVSFPSDESHARRISTITNMCGSV